MEEKQELPETEVSRREFVRLALLSLTSSAALLGLSRTMEGAQSTGRSMPSFGVFQPLLPGTILPQGWLRTYLKKEGAELGSKLPHISIPFTQAYWAGEETAESWWPWEQKAYWLDGATRLAIVLQDEQLMAQVRKTIDYTLTHAAADGYLGPQFFADPKGDFHRWPHALLFRGLAALSDANFPEGSERDGIVVAMQKHYVSDKASYGTPTRNVINIESMLWCYERTGDPRLLELAESSWQEFMKGGADPEHGNLSPQLVYADSPIECHGVTYAEVSKQPAVLYLHTGKEPYLRFAVAAQRRIFEHHMLVDGVPSTSESYRTTTALDSHETCDISDHTWAWGFLLMATGDAVWADHVERACFNAGAGAIKNDWKALQYFSCPNQFLATLNSDHNALEPGGFLMAYQPNPGKAGACCGGNVHRLFPNYVIRMWMKTNNGGLAAVLYGPSKVKTTVGPDNQPIEIEQTTHYPFDEQIHFKISTDRPVSFPLSLRIPGWCHAPRLTVNGAAVAVSRTQLGFTELRRTFHPGDVITLTLPMKIAVTHWPHDGIALERGPLVYSLPIEGKWVPRVEAKYTTPDYPSWELTPQSPWSYGIALSDENLEHHVEVERSPVIEEADGAWDPWENPPIALRLVARRIENWDLESNPEDANQKFTPPLPDLNEVKASEATEHLRLVPYGSTHLRITIFPSLRS
jgi:hypothetical protein